MTFALGEPASGIQLINKRIFRARAIWRVAGSTSWLPVTYVDRTPGLPVFAIKGFS